MTWDSKRATELADGLGTWAEMQDMLRAAVAEVEQRTLAGDGLAKGFQIVCDQRDRLAADLAAARAKLESLKDADRQLDSLAAHALRMAERARKWEAELHLAREVVRITKEWHANPGPTPTGFWCALNAIATYDAHVAKESK